MVAVVHGGNLGRWFEELCRIRFIRLLDVVSDRQESLKPGLLPHDGGVYAFWWTGPIDLIRSSKCNRLIELHGPGGRPVQLKIDDEWLGL